MSRLPLLALVFLLLGSSSSAAPAPAPKEGPAIVEARAFLKVSCAAAKDSCVQTKRLFDDYLAVLHEAFACMGKQPCKVETVNQIYERDRKLDEREHLLPPKARSADSARPLLRLSLFVITAAGMALEAADPKAKPPAHGNDAVEATKVLERMCQVGAAKACAEGHAIVEEAAVLDSGAAACEAKPCAFAEQERQAIAAETALSRYFGFSDNTLLDTSSIFGLILHARSRIAQILARTSAAKLAELEAGDRALSQGVSKLESGAGRAGQYAALKARETEVLKVYKDAAIMSDRTYSLLGMTPGTSNFRPRINASAARLASARGRLIALNTARGFGGAPSIDDKGGVSAMRKVIDAAAMATMPLAYLGQTRRRSAPAAAPRPVPIDRRAVPIAPPANPTAPPIIKSNPPLLANLVNSQSKDPLIKADALRRLGLTTTLGDPSGRAPLLHPQKASDTCAIVSQQQILMAHGLITKNDPVGTEALLAKEAKERGFYAQGTPPAYQADLLVDRGLLVVKQRGAPIATLDAAVRRGGMIIASVDARALWGVKSPDTLGHSIVITGAEVNRLTGATLGYYINDSGVPSGGAGRFVPIEQFKKAWNPYTKNFAEVR